MRGEGFHGGRCSCDAEESKLRRVGVDLGMVDVSPKLELPWISGIQRKHRKATTAIAKRCIMVAAVFVVVQLFFLSPSDFSVSPYGYVPSKPLLISPNKYTYHHR
jgi:hypothetical protein